MADLEFKIKTPAELQGAEAAARALEVNIGKAKALGKEYTDLEARLRTVTASINAFTAAQAQSANAAQAATDDSQRYAAALEKMDHDAHEAKATEAQRLIDLRNTTKGYGDSLDDVSTKTGLLNFRKSELKKLVGELKREFPVLGNIMRIALDPRLLGITLLIQAFRLLNDQIKRTAELLEPSEWAGRGEAIASGKKAFEDATIAANQYWHDLNRAVTEMDALSAATSEQTRKIHEQATAEAAKRDANEGYELAKVDAEEKKGRIGPETAAFRRAEIKERYAMAGDTAKTIEENKALNVLLEERSKLLKIVADLELKLPQQQQAAAAAAAENVIVEKERSIVADDIAKSKAKIAAYEDELAQRSKFGMRSTIYDSLTDESVQSSMASEMSARDAAQRRLNRIDDEHVGRTTANRNLISDTGAMESNLSGARRRLDTLNPEIDSRLESYQAGIKNRGSLAALRVATARAGDVGPDTLMTAAAGADAIRGGGRASPDQANAINKGAAALGMQGQNTDLILQIMARFNDDAEALKRGLQALAQRQADSANKSDFNMMP